MSGDFFSMADMAELEDAAESAMAGTLVIRRQTNSNNGDGTYNVAYNPVGTVACHVWPSLDSNSNEKATGGQVVSIGGWYLAVANGTDIRVIDRCDYNGSVTYEITEVSPTITWQPQLRCKALTYNGEVRS